MTGNLQRRSNNKDLKEELELPFFNMDELACATNNFSVSNKLGQGGFGPVYKVIIIHKQSCNIASDFSWYKLQEPMEFCSIEIVPLQNQPFFSIKGWLIEKNSWTDTSCMKYSKNSADNAWFAYDAESLFTGKINRWTRNSCQEAL